MKFHTIINNLEKGTRAIIDRAKDPFWVHDGTKWIKREKSWIGLPVIQVSQEFSQRSMTGKDKVKAQKIASKGFRTVLYTLLSEIALETKLENNLIIIKQYEDIEIISPLTMAGTIIFVMRMDFSLVFSPNHHGILNNGKFVEIPEVINMSTRMMKRLINEKTVKDVMES